LMGEKGIGYYKDSKPKVDKKELAEIIEWIQD
jgi:hypothetical protein